MKAILHEPSNEEYSIRIFFKEAMNFLIKNEGSRVSKNPNDHAGISRYGISLNSPNIKSYGITTVFKLSRISREKASEFYYKEFWVPSQIKSFVHNFAYCTPSILEIAIKLFDTGVNIGMKKSIELLQYSLNNMALTKKLVVDGILGDSTQEICFKVYCDKPILVDNFIEALKLHYHKLISSNPKLKVFEKGWMVRAERKYTVKS